MREACQLKKRTRSCWSAAIDQGSGHREETNEIYEFLMELVAYADVESRANIQAAG